MQTQLVLYCILRAERKMLVVVGRQFLVPLVVHNWSQPLLCRAASALALYKTLMAAMDRQWLHKSWLRGLVVCSLWKSFGKKFHTKLPVLRKCFAQKGQLRSEVARSSGLAP